MCSKSTETINCEICGFKAYSEKYLLHHQRSDHPDFKKTFSCEKCHFKSDKFGHLTRHIELCALSEELHECNICKYKAHSKAALIKHSSKEHSIMKLEEKCDRCDYKTLSVSQLNNHNLKCMQVTDFQICSECGHRAMSNLALGWHFKSEHPNIHRTFKCTDCDFEAKTSYRLNKHLEKCALTPKLNCTDCDFKCISHLTLKKHNSEVHIQLNNLKRKKCNFSTDFGHIEKTHEATGTSGKC